jgi:hypothetical protein
MTTTAAYPLNSELPIDDNMRKAWGEWHLASHVESSDATPKKIVTYPKNKSRMRSKTLRCLEFGVLWEDGDFTEEPITNLVDFTTKEVNVLVAPFLEQYAATTKRYPSCRRMCWFCPKYCARGDNFCTEHAKTCSWITEEDKSPDPTVLVWALPLTCP